MEYMNLVKTCKDDSDVIEEVCSFKYSLLLLRTERARQLKLPVMLERVHLALVRPGYPSYHYEKELCDFADFCDLNKYLLISIKQNAKEPGCMRL